MLKRVSAIILALVLFAVVAPSYAAEKVSSLPAVTPVTSGFMDFALAGTLVDAVSGETLVEVLGYGQGRFSGDRVHVVSVDPLNNQKTEVKIIGDRIYVLLPGETKWITDRVDVVTPISDPSAPSVPDQGSFEIYKVGDTTVRGAATTQYQIALPLTDADKQSGLSSVVDEFIGKADNYLHKTQISVRGTDPDVGSLSIELPIDISAFNQPQTIDEPTADEVQTLRAAAVAGNNVPGAAKMPVWLRPIVAQAISK